MLAGAAHRGPFRLDTAAVVHSCAAGLCSAPLPQRPRALPRSPVSTVRAPGCPAGHLWCPRASGQPVSAGRVDLAPLNQRRREAQRARCRRCGTAAAGPPQSCRSRPGSRTRGRCPGSFGTGRRGCPLPLPEPRSVSGRWSVSGRSVSAGWVSGRLVSGRSSVRRGHCRSLRVSAATGTGRLAGVHSSGAATDGTHG
jgi:hypothetical protein